MIATGTKITIDGTTYTTIKLGDVNGDGEVDARDALKILRYSVDEIKLENEFLEAADVNNDNTFDARDALKILNYSIDNAKINI